MTYDEMALSWKPHPCPQLHQDQQEAINLCMADTWRRQSGSAGNEPLYHHLWCGQGTQWCGCAKGWSWPWCWDVGQTVWTLCYVTTCWCPLPAHCPPCVLFWGKCEIRSAFVPILKLAPKNTSSCRQCRCHLSRKSHLIYLFLPVNTTTLWKT